MLELLVGSVLATALIFIGRRWGMQDSNVQISVHDIRKEAQPRWTYNR